MINPQFFLNAPRFFKQGVKIYPPTVNDIVKNQAFAQYKDLLLLSQEEIEDIFVQQNSDTEISEIPTPLEYLMQVCYYNRAVEREIKKVFEVFIHTTVTFVYGKTQIMIGDFTEVVKNATSVQDLIFITEEDYFDFQNALRESLGQKPIDPPNPNEHPKIKKMKAKARYRDRIKAKKGHGISLGASLASICCMGLGITPLNIGELSYVAFLALMDYYQEKEKYHLDIEALLAGGDKKKIKPKYWIRNLD